MHENHVQKIIYFIHVYGVERTTTKLNKELVNYNVINKQKQTKKLNHIKNYSTLIVLFFWVFFENEKITFLLVFSQQLWGKI